MKLKRNSQSTRDKTVNNMLHYYYIIFLMMAMEFFILYLLFTFSLRINDMKLTAIGKIYS